MQASPNPPMIEIKQVSKWYGSFQVLDACTTAVAKGEVVVVCGPSGSGKSTLIKTVNALEPFQQGEIIVNGTSVGDPRTNLPKLRSVAGMVFQHFELFPHLSVTENLCLGQVKVLGRGRDEARQRALALLERVACRRTRTSIRRVVRRPAAARGDRARAVDGSGGHVVRRADLGAGPRDGQRGAGRDDGPGRRRHDHDGGDP